MFNYGSTILYSNFVINALITLNINGQFEVENIKITGSFQLIIVSVGFITEYDCLYISV